MINDNEMESEMTELIPDVLALLPKRDLVGTTEHWTLPAGNSFVELDGRFLGFSTSYRHRHINHAHNEFAVASERCSACRWFEPRIFRETEGQRRFLIHRAGISIVPGESTRTSYEWVISAYEVVEALTTRKATNKPPERCPVCKGRRRVSFPPGTAGDIDAISTNSDKTYPCEACDGEGIIYAESAYLTPPAARVLAQAASFDVDLENAYIDRAVS